MDKIIIGILLLPFALILIGLALLIAIYAIIWAVIGIIYCLVFALLVVIFGIDKELGTEEDFAHFVIFSGLLTLIPIIILVLNMHTDNLIPQNIATWSISFSAINWFSFISGGIYSSITCLLLFVIKIMNKILPCFNKEEKCLIAYLTIISQITVAGIIIKLSIAHNVFSNHDLFNAIIPIPIIFLILIVFIGICKGLVNRKKIETGASIHYTKGDELYNKKCYEQAIQEYKKAHEIERNDSFHYCYAVGLTYSKMRYYENAKTFLNKALQFETSSECYYELANAYFNLYEHEKSIECLDKLLKELNRNDSEYSKCEQLKLEYQKKASAELFNTAIYCINDKDFTDAIFYIKKAISIDPNNEEYHLKLAEIKQQKEQEINNADKYYQEAKTYLQDENYAQALSLINEVLRNNNDEKFVSLKQEIISAEEADKLYNKAKKLYDLNKGNYDNVVQLLNAANKKFPHKKYQEFKNKIEKESVKFKEIKQAENNYK